jgi:outer membrane immunogenic protein
MFVRKCVRSCGVALCATVIASSAQAADYYSSSTGNYGGYKDLPAKAPEPSWQGLYLGISGGWSWTSIDAANNVLILTNNGTVPFSSPGTNGVFGGGQIGYNFQSGIFVYGIEADFDALDDTASGSVTDPHNPARVLSVKSSTGLYSDITGRAGLLMGNALFYAKGGLALFTGNVHVGDPADHIGQDSGTLLGWTLGGGVEYQLTNNLTVKAEYQYFDVDNTNFSCCLPSSAGRLEDQITANTLKIGVNYLTDWKHSPLD